MSTKGCAVLLHEIYGRNAHMQYYKADLEARGYDVVVPNMLAEDSVFRYDEEEQAYAHFMNEVGFERAQQQVLALLNELAMHYKQITLVGFSIGATVAWLCSEHRAVTRVIGFYGSRIRQYTSIEPRAHTTLIYGLQEVSFDPKTLLDTLTTVDVHIVDAAHGFMDPYAPTYNEHQVQSVLQYIWKEDESQ